MWLNHFIHIKIFFYWQLNLNITKTGYKLVQDLSVLPWISLLQGLFQKYNHIWEQLQLVCLKAYFQIIHDEKLHSCNSFKILC